VCNVPGKQYEVLAVGSDKQITTNVKLSKGKTDVTANDLVSVISQIVITPSGKSVIAGVGEANRPGAIQIWLRPEDKPLDKVNEVQAHSKPVGVLRLSDDCQNLFSVGADGLLCIFEVRDRDPRSAKKAVPSLMHSQEILTEHAEMEKQLSEKEALRQEDNSMKELDNNSNVEKNMEVDRLHDKINSLNGRLESDKIDAESKFLSLQENKREAQNNNENKRKDLLDRQQEVIEQKRNEYSQKMLEDSGRFNQLQVQKEEERLMYQNSLDKVKRDHLEKIQAEQEAHRKEIEVKNTQIDQMKREIKQILKENDEILSQIKEDTEFEVKDITKKNDNNKSQVNDMSLKSKAELQLTSNKLGDIDNEIEQLVRQIQDKNTQNKRQDEDCEDLKKKIAEKLKLIHQKDD